MMRQPPRSTRPDTLVPYTPLSRSPGTASRNNRKAPAVKVDKRPRPPDVTLITDCPIIAQPPMPPKKAATILAPPCPAHSRCLSLSVSVMSSTICSVSGLSGSPTYALARERTKGRRGGDEGGGRG